MHEVRLKIRYASLLLFGFFWVFDVVIDTGKSAKFCRKLAFCEAGSCSRYLEISSSCLVRFVLTYLCPVKSRRRDCNRKVK